MSSIDPIGPYHGIRPAGRVAGVSRKSRHEEDDTEERRGPEDDPSEDEEEPPGDDRPAPQHVDLRG